MPAPHTVGRAGSIARASEADEVTAVSLLWGHAARYPAHRQLVAATLAELARYFGYPSLQDYCSYHMLCALDIW